MTTFTVEQDDREYAITPIESGEPVEDFYGSSGTVSSTGVENSDGSVLFFHLNPDGSLRLVVIHDYPGDESGGAVSFELTLAGSATDAEWLLMDDNNDFDGATDTSPDWTWNDRNKDGGALDAPFGDEFELTIEPAFNDAAAREPLTPGRLDSWEVLSGGETNDAENPVREPLDMTQSLTISPGGREVSASVTTLQFIPGRNENVSEGGSPLEGSLMQVFEEGTTIEAGDWFEKELPVGPVLDSWLKGDQTYVEGEVRPGDDELSENIENAKQKVLGKYSDEFPERSYHKYRFENHVDVSFQTESDSIIEKSLRIEFNESGEEPNDSSIFLKGRENPATVTPKSEINGVPVTEWHDGFEERSNRKSRHYKYDAEFEFDGVEGVRVLTISGGYAGFVADWARRVGNNPAGFLSTVWDWGVDPWVAKLALSAALGRIHTLIDYLSVVPNTYTFIDFIVLADGRRYARVWDASQYPSLATYVDGTRRALEKMPYEPRQELNSQVVAFLLQASLGATPYHSPLDLYGRLIEDEELMETLLTDGIQQSLSELPVNWGVSELLPRVPRETVGYDADGNPLENPDEPFNVSAGLRPFIYKTIDPE